MAMNLARVGTAAVLGLASGALTPNVKAGIPALQISADVAIEYGTILEAVALVGGAIMQFASPYSIPDVVDGLVDGGAALLMHRAGTFGMKQAFPYAVGGYASAGRMANGYIGGASPWNMAASPCVGAAARPAAGNISGLPKKELV